MAGWIRNIFFTEILKGFQLTFKHMFVKEITDLYPHQKRELPKGYRGVIAHLRYDDGQEKCVGCALCEAACPSHCITVTSAEDPEIPQRRIAKEYILDVTKCVFCGFCVQACPVDALASSPEYEMATWNKRELMMDKEAMLALGDRYFPERAKRPPYTSERFSFFQKMSQTQFPTTHKEGTVPREGTVPCEVSA